MRKFDLNKELEALWLATKIGYFFEKKVASKPQYHT